jgi:4a-hydroxytetrahydrobiopterin dehydratase
MHVSDLAPRKCRPCQGGTSPLPADEAAKLQEQLDPGWQIVEEGRALKRELSFKDFYQTMSFVNAVAHIANIEDHHPDLEVGYGYCRIRYSTHSIGGLSENDFICAAKIDAL